MPDIDGYEVLRGISLNADLSEISVLVISSLEDIKEIVEPIRVVERDWNGRQVWELNGQSTQRICASEIHSSSRQSLKQLNASFQPLPSPS